MEFYHKCKLILNSVLLEAFKGDLFKMHFFNLLIFLISNCDLFIYLEWSYPVHAGLKIQYAVKNDLEFVTLLAST